MINAPMTYLTLNRLQSLWSDTKTHHKNSRCFMKYSLLRIVAHRESRSPNYPSVNKGFPMNISSHFILFLLFQSRFTICSTILKAIQNKFNLISLCYTNTSLIVCELHGNMMLKILHWIGKKKHHSDFTENYTKLSYAYCSSIQVGATQRRIVIF